MTLSNNLLVLLSRQYFHEISNSILYTHLFSWADMRGLDGTSGFFKKQADGERSHADMVLSYISDRNLELLPNPVELPPVAPKNYRELFLLAQDRERLTTEKIAEIKAQAEAESDMMTCAWLMQPGNLVMEQIEEENIIQTIIDRLDARSNMVPLQNMDAVPADAGGNIIHDIDVWLKSL